MVQLCPDREERGNRRIWHPQFVDQQHAKPQSATQLQIFSRTVSVLLQITSAIVGCTT